jgi:hypothetical protein
LIFISKSIGHSNSLLRGKLFLLKLSFRTKSLGILGGQEGLILYFPNQSNLVFLEKNWNIGKVLTGLAHMNHAAQLRWKRPRAQSTTGQIPHMCLGAIQTATSRSAHPSPSAESATPPLFRSLPTFTVALSSVSCPSMRPNYFSFSPPHEAKSH